MKYGKMSLCPDGSLRLCKVTLLLDTEDGKFTTFDIIGVPSGVAAELLIRWNCHNDLKDELNSLKGAPDGAV